MKFNLIAAIAIFAFVAVTAVSSVEAEFNFSVCYGTHPDDCQDCCDEKGFDWDKSIGYGQYGKTLVYQCGCWQAAPKQA